MESTVEYSYKDPAALTIIGIILIIIGLVMLYRGRGESAGSSNGCLKFLFLPDSWSMIILGMGFIFIAFGILETFATIVVILIILKKFVLWF